MIRFRLFSIDSYPNLCTWYQEMARKGWFIQRISSSFIHHFKKGEPRDLEYVFEPLPQTNKTQLIYGEEFHEFTDLAASIGLNYIGRVLNLLLFSRNTNNSARSIYESEKERRELLKEQSISLVRKQTIQWSLLFIFNIYLLYKNFSDETSSNNLYFSILGKVTIILIAISYVLHLGKNIFFLTRNRKAFDDASIPIRYNTRCIETVSTSFYFSSFLFLFILSLYVSFELSSGIAYLLLPVLILPTISGLGVYLTFLLLEKRKMEIIKRTLISIIVGGLLFASTAFGFYKLYQLDCIPYKFTTEGILPKETSEVQSPNETNETNETSEK